MLVSGILTVELLQTLAVEALVITGFGFTVITAVVDDEQLFAVALMVNVVTCCAFVVFVNVPLIGVPAPLAAMPVRFTVLSLVQLNVVVATALGLDIAIDVIAMPEHKVCVLFVALTDGVGFTATVAVIAVPGHPFEVGVMVNVTVTSAIVVLFSVPVISPLPLAAIPVTVPVLFLVQL